MHIVHIFEILLCGLLHNHPSALPSVHVFQHRSHHGDWFFCHAQIELCSLMLSNMGAIGAQCVCCARAVCTFHTVLCQRRILCGIRGIVVVGHHLFTAHFLKNKT